MYQYNPTYYNTFLYCIMTEKEILAGITHPFLVKMKLSFQDEQKLYFLLEYCPGG